MKEVNPELKICFVGPHVTALPEESLAAAGAIDFIVRKEFDQQVVDFANGKPVSEIPSVSFRENGGFIHNPEAQPIDNLDALPWVTKVYKRDLDFTRYNVPFLLHPYLAFYTERGCPGAVHVLLMAADVVGAPLANPLGGRRGGRGPMDASEFPGAEGDFLRRRHVQHSQVASHRAVREG